MVAPTCPSCNSGNVQKSSAVVDGGTSHGTFSQTGVGVSTGGIGVGASKGKSTAISVAAQKNAAPDDGVAGVATLGFIGGAILWWLIELPFLAGIFLCFTLAAVAGICFANITKDERKKAAERYNKQWYCHACGMTFQRR